MRAVGQFGIFEWNYETVLCSIVVLLYRRNSRVKVYFKKYVGLVWKTSLISETYCGSLAGSAIDAYKRPMHMPHSNQQTINDRHNSIRQV